MELTEISFLGGLVLGLASTLHCAAMCGAISCATLLSLGPSTPRERVIHAVLLQTGRILAYCALGIVGAAIGSAFVAPGTTVNFRVLQWIGAVVLMWTGLAMAGMMPRLAVLDAGMVRLSDGVAAITRPLRGTPGAPVALGAIWGLNPCPMVYGAVFTATITGSIWAGVSVMAGFGLGTVPGVLATGLGLTAMKGVHVSRAAQVAVGLLIAVLGFATLYVPAAHIAALCLN